MREQAVQDAIREAIPLYNVQNKIPRNQRINCFRCNVGTVWTGDFDKNKKIITNPRLFKTGLPNGFSDLFCVVPIIITPEMVGTQIAIAGFLEVKKPKGSKTSDDQISKDDNYQDIKYNHIWDLYVNLQRDDILLYWCLNRSQRLKWFTRYCKQYENTPYAIPIDFNVFSDYMIYLFAMYREIYGNTAQYVFKINNLPEYHKNDIMRLIPSNSNVIIKNYADIVVNFERDMDKKCFLHRNDIQMVLCHLNKLFNYQYVGLKHYMNRLDINNMTYLINYTSKLNINIPPNCTFILVDGLSVDISKIIASHIRLFSIRMIGRCAQVCKTWRAIFYLAF